MTFNYGAGTNALPRVPGRPEPPAWTVPLTGLDSRGRARTITRVPGKTVRLDGSATIDVRRFRFELPNVSIPAGSTLRWGFLDSKPHNVISPTGRSASRR